MEVISLRRSRLFVLLVLALVLFPARAFAWDVIPKGVLYQTVLDDSRTGYVVSAYNQFDAAAYALGKDPNTISAEAKVKLSDSDYGGKFYDYAQSFFTQSGGLDNVPTWVPTYVIMVSELADLVYADYQAVWYSTATYSLYQDAMVDLVRVLNGDDLGPSTPSTPSTPEVVPGSFTSVSLQSFNWRYKNGKKNNSFYVTATSAVFEDGQLSVGSSTRRVSPWGSSNYYVPSFNAYVSSDAMEYAYSLVNQGYDVVFSFDPLNYNGTYFSGVSGRIIYGHGFSFAEVSPGGDDLATQLYGSDFHSVSFSQQHPVYFDSSGPFSFIDGSPSEPALDSGNFLFVAIFSSPIYGIDNPPPAGDWPEPDSPVSPVEPELPDPTTPTVEPEPVVVAPTVTWPDIDITVNPPSVVVPTTPDGQDYTQLLTLINDNLNSINAYTVSINSSLGSIDSDLLVGFDSVVRSIRNVYTYLQHLDDVLERHCVHIRNQIEDSASFLANYVRQLVHWLAEQIDYDSDVTGSNDLFGILSTISNKLGGGTYEPNPISDEQGYYEWLDDLWDRFLLGDDWENSASSMSQDFDQLTTRFPFSVPWDIVALFRLFVHDPVTPVFDLPLYYSSEGSTPVHVDLSPWDGVAAVVRPLLFVIFALKLALLSRNLLGGFGSESGV